MFFGSDTRASFIRKRKRKPFGVVSVWDLAGQGKIPFKNREHIIRPGYDSIFSSSPLSSLRSFLLFRYVRSSLFLFLLLFSFLFLSSLSPLFSLNFLFEAILSGKDALLFNSCCITCCISLPGASHSSFFYNSWHSSPFAKPFQTAPDLGAFFDKRWLYFDNRTNFDDEKMLC